MTLLRALNDLRRPWRLAAKWILFAATVLFVCFPYPNRLVRHIQRWRNPNALLQRDTPALQPLLEELRGHIGPECQPVETLHLVERFVYEKIPYDWDWNTWGTADYLPTVDEALAKGREDCDGRAVVAAALLRSLGFQAELVTDFGHVWVHTQAGDTMSPGEEQAVEATDQGLRIRWKALGRLPRALAYGVAPFPLIRELIIVGVMWILLLRTNGSVRRNVSGLAFFLVGLFLLRAGGRDYRNPMHSMQIVGLLSFLAGFIVLWKRTRPTSRPAADEPGGGKR